MSHSSWLWQVHYPPDQVAVVWRKWEWTQREMYQLITVYVDDSCWVIGWCLSIQSPYSLMTAQLLRHTHQLTSEIKQSSHRKTGWAWRRSFSARGSQFNTIQNGDFNYSKIKSISMWCHYGAKISIWHLTLMVCWSLSISMHFTSFPSTWLTFNQTTKHWMSTYQQGNTVNWWEFQKLYCEVWPRTDNIMGWFPAGWHKGNTWNTTLFDFGI